MVRLLVMNVERFVAAKEALNFTNEECMVAMNQIQMNWDTDSL